VSRAEVAAGAAASADRAATGAPACGAGATTATVRTTNGARPAARASSSCSPWPTRHWACTLPPASAGGAGAGPPAGEHGELHLDAGHWVAGDILHPQDERRRAAWGQLGRWCLVHRQRLRPARDHGHGHTELGAPARDPELRRADRPGRGHESVARDVGQRPRFGSEHDPGAADRLAGIVIGLRGELCGLAGAQLEGRGRHDHGRYLALWRGRRLGLPAAGE
jgi:hypothetical protein